MTNSAAREQVPNRQLKNTCLPGRPIVFMPNCLISDCGAMLRPAAGVSTRNTSTRLLLNHAGATWTGDGWKSDRESFHRELKRHSTLKIRGEFEERRYARLLVCASAAARARHQAAPWQVAPSRRRQLVTPRRARHSAHKKNRCRIPWSEIVCETALR